MNSATTLGILLQVLLSKTHGAIELVCGVTSPDMPSSMTCQCNSTEGNGVEWRSNGTYTANCFFPITPSCSPVPNGYTFSSNNTELVFTMTLDPYIYSECRSFTCIDIIDTTKQQIKIPSAIEFDSTAPTGLTEPGANHTNGNISLTTNCISGYANIITEWYIIYNGSEVRYTPDSETLITKKDSTSCTSCNSEKAKSVTIGFTHKEAIGSSTQAVYFKVKVYHPSYPLASLERTSSYVYAVKGDHMEDDDGSIICCCKLIIPLTLFVPWIILFFFHRCVFKIPTENSCSYYLPFAISDWISSKGKCKEEFWKKALGSFAVDAVFIILVILLCLETELCCFYIYLIIATIVVVIHIGIMFATSDTRLKCCNCCREKQSASKPVGTYTGQQAKDSSGNLPGQQTKNSSGNQPGQQTKDSSGNRPGQQTKDSSGNQPGQQTKVSSGNRPGQQTKDSSGNQPQRHKSMVQGELQPGSSKPGGNGPGQQAKDSSGNQPGQQTKNSSGNQPGQQTKYSSGNRPGQQTKDSSGNQLGQQTKDSSGSRPGQQTKDSSGNQPQIGARKPGGNNTGQQAKDSSGNQPGQHNKDSSGNRPGQQTKDSSVNRPGQQTEDTSGNQPQIHKSMVQGELQPGARKPGGNNTGQQANDSSGNQPGQQTKDSSGNQPGQQTKDLSGNQPGQQTKDSSGYQPRQQTKDSSGYQPGLQTKDSSGNQPQRHKSMVQGELQPVQEKKNLDNPQQLAAQQNNHNPQTTGVRTPSTSQEQSQKTAATPPMHAWGEGQAQKTNIQHQQDKLQTATPTQNHEILQQATKQNEVTQWTGYRSTDSTKPTISATET